MEKIGNKNSLIKKTIIYLATWYMKHKTNIALNFPYKTKETNIPVLEKGKKYLLYIHIPFCRILCPFCSFHKFIFVEKVAVEYFKLLRKELLIAKSYGYDFGALYIGGGTTTILADELAQTIDLAKELFSIEEVSCETDPNMSDTTIELLKNRVDRLSIGMQSFDDNILKKMGRYKKNGTGIEQFEKIKKLKGIFKIINVDMIFNIPNQSQSLIEYDLEKLIQLDVDQVSYYPLMYSPTIKKRIEKSLGKIGGDNEINKYNLILKSLSANYNQVSSWAFTNKNSNNKIFDEYIVDYEEYVGLGSGSFSFINDKLYINTFSLKEYETYINANKLSIQRVKKYNRKDIQKYRLMVSLFGMNDFETLNKNYPYMFKLMRLLGILKKNELQATDFGKYFFLVLMKSFYIGMDYVRESSRETLTKEDEVFKENKKQIEQK